VRPAWYALSSGGWRDYVTLLHPPYTAWHLSYVVVGGCLAPTIGWGRLGLAVLAFALALGVGAHALDELNGRPLRTRIPERTLLGLAVVSVAAACAIGIAVAFTFDPFLLVFVAAGAFLVPAYNLELLGGRFHSDLWFGLAWGAFPLLTGYAACAGSVSEGAVLAASWATLLSLAQRQLSTPVRRLRREVASVTGRLELADGSSEPLDAASLTSAPEAALRLLTAATVVLAAALVAVRL
jgi:heme O synthase-like polyprenyltransferase